MKVYCVWSDSSQNYEFCVCRATVLLLRVVEAVTHRENVLRGNIDGSFGQSYLRAQTHCRNGHSYEGCYAQKGARRCKECQRAATARWQAKKRLLVAA